MSLTFISSLSARECCINFEFSIRWSIFLSSANIAHVNVHFDNNKMPAFLCSPSTFAAECNSGCCCVSRNSHAPIIHLDSLSAVRRFPPSLLESLGRLLLRGGLRGEAFLSFFFRIQHLAFSTIPHYSILIIVPLLLLPFFSSSALLLLPDAIGLIFFCFPSRQVITPASRLLRACEVVRTACLALRAA